MTLEEKKYFELCKAPAPISSHTEGIIVASDLTQEWMLPWWWAKYSQFNNFPVTFVDLGLSPEMKAWCKEKGNYVHLPVSGIFVREKTELPSEFVSSLEKNYGKKVWDSRSAWFRKPLACLQSPYESSLWIDLDCEIKGSLKPLFSFCKHPSGISVARELWENDEIGFNSGVIAFSKESKIIQKWALESFSKHLDYPGDQDVLAHVIKKEGLSVGDIPFIYNWSRLKGSNPEAIILHWHGSYGKSIISHQILKENLS